MYNDESSITHTPVYIHVAIWKSMKLTVVGILLVCQQFHLFAPLLIVNGLNSRPACTNMYRAFTAPGYDIKEPWKLQQGCSKALQISWPPSHQFFSLHIWILWVTFKIFHFQWKKMWKSLKIGFSIQSLFPEGWIIVFLQSLMPQHSCQSYLCMGHM